MINKNNINNTNNNQPVKIFGVRCPKLSCEISEKRNT